MIPRWTCRAELNLCFCKSDCGSLQHSAGPNPHRQCSAGRTGLQQEMRNYQRHPASWFRVFLHLKVIWSMPRFIWSEEQLQKRLPKIRLRFFFGVVLQIQFLATDESLWVFSKENASGWRPCRQRYFAESVWSAEIAVQGQRWLQNKAAESSSLSTHFHTIMAWWTTPFLGFGDTHFKGHEGLYESVWSESFWVQSSCFFLWFSRLMDMILKFIKPRRWRSGRISRK